MARRNGERHRPRRADLLLADGAGIEAAGATRRLRQPRAGGDGLDERGPDHICVGRSAGCRCRRSCGRRCRNREVLHGRADRRQAGIHDERGGDRGQARVDQRAVLVVLHRRPLDRDLELVSGGEGTFGLVGVLFTDFPCAVRPEAERVVDRIARAGGRIGTEPDE